MAGQHISVDLRDVDRLMQDLKTFQRSAVPFAVRHSLNAGAFEGRKLWVGEVRTSFVLRNRFTERSLRVDKAKGLRVDRMQATLGSVAEYLDEQERGGTVWGKAGRSKPIPTTTAAGQSMSAPVRTRQVQRAKRLTAIRLPKRPGGSKQQRNAVAISQAQRAGSRFVYMELPKVKGIFELRGKLTARRSMRRGGKSLVRLVWSLGQRSVRVPAAHTLRRTLDAVQPRLAAIHVVSLIEQLRRHGVLGY